MDTVRALNRVRALVAQHDWPQARSVAQAALATHPDNAELWFLLGVSLHASGEGALAADAFRRTVTLSPEFIPALNALATVLAELGDLNESLDVLDRALALAPSQAPVWFNRGVVLERLARSLDALEAYDRAMALDPSFIPARLNRGALLMMLGRYNEAVENNREHVRRAPNSADAHFNLAEALLGSGASLEALAVCDRALALDPRHAKAHIDRGLALSDLGRFREAQAAFDVAELTSPGAMGRYLDAIAPSDPSLQRAFDPRLVFLYRGYERLAHCDWSLRDDYVERLTHLVLAPDNSGDRHIDLPLAYHALAVEVPAEVPYQISRTIGKRYADAVAETGVQLVHAQQQGRIRVGYFSPDFREHLNAYLANPLFRDRDRARFEVFGYGIGPLDDSAIGAEITRGADVFRDLSSMSDSDAARRINADGIDLLVDLGGYTRYCRPGIAAFRPAPVQVSYLGFPATTGASWMDYRITDPIATPAEQEKLWTEKLVFLPDTFFIYDRFEQLQETSISRDQYAIPDEAFVFCCHNNYYKIEPRVFTIWMEILTVVPQGILWLAGRDPAAAANLRREAELRGVRGERLIFAPFEARERYRARFGLADLFLDTPIFNAMTTACDALAAGLPLLTVAGSAFPARVAASLLTAADFTEGITQSLNEYRDRAIEWGNKPEELIAIRRRRMSDPLSSRLFDTRARVRQLESAYIEMWRRHEQGLAPATFDVPALPATDWRNNWH